MRVPSVSESVRPDLEHASVSDTNRPRLKVSRAGIVLIKSFESFRPRAVQRDDGGWVIGYGHTASAREGLTVGEQDAELLLQYDLIPVAKALNERVETGLNQHQFDALSSFAVSVGVDRFLTSDVLKRVNAGQAGEAADALIGWPETLPADAGLRRRAAERALFVADPASPVMLADLLAAPLPPPPVEPVAAPAEAPVEDPVPLSRAAAVASLLGEPHAPEAETPEVEAPEPEVEPAATEAEPEPASEAVEASTPSTPLPLPSVWAPQMTADLTKAPAATFLQRYSPYSTLVVGPLPGFPVLGPEPEAVAEPEPEPEVQPVQPVEPAPAPVAPEPEPEPTPEPAPTPEPVVVEVPAAPVPAPIEMPVFTQPVFRPQAPSPFPPLELTPAVEADFAEPARQSWTPDQRETAPETADEAVLFEEEPPLAVLRHEVEATPTRRFDWIETGPYLIMGGLGLFSCAA
ncbi:MAG: hypothetical protein EON85_10610, partial [Brevundimonas sp.]